MNSKTLQKILAHLVPGIASTLVSAGEFKATIEIPRLNVAEYHRPYVAAWIETPDREVTANLALWYDLEMRDREGETWLKDLRQWWRKSGRSLDLPIDGLSRPTQPAGIHEVSVDMTGEPLSELAEGDYFLVVEAAREVGGRELLRLPFNWSKGKAVDVTMAGERELGTVSLKIENN